MVHVLVAEHVNVMLGSHHQIVHYVPLIITDSHIAIVFLLFSKIPITNFS